MKKGDKVVCVGIPYNNDRELTLNKIYDVFYDSDGSIIWIVNNHYELACYKMSLTGYYFKSLSEIRSDKIDEICK